MARPDIHMQKARDSMRASEKPQEGAKRSSQGPVKSRVLEPTAQALPYGDPSETTTAPRHHCQDVVVEAHGATTRAAPGMGLVGLGRFS